MKEIKKLEQEIEKIISLRVEYHYQEKDESYMIGSPEVLAKAITRHIVSVLPTKEGLTQRLLNAMMEEAKRNNKVKGYHDEGYKYNPLCSCGICHLSNLLARICLDAIKKNWGLEP